MKKLRIGAIGAIIPLCLAFALCVAGCPQPTGGGGGNGNGNSGDNGSSVSTVPGTPGAPELTPGYKRLTVSWAAVTGASSYEVYLDQEIAPVKTPAAPFVELTGLENGTDYQVRIKAKNGAGTSGLSVQKSAAPALTAPQPSVIQGNTELSIGWAAESGVAYQVFYGTSSGSANTPLGGGDISGSSATITSLSNGSTYFVRLKAKADGATSDYGLESKEVKPAAPQSPDTGFVYVPGGTVAGSASYAMTVTVPNNPTYNFPGQVSTHKGVFVRGRTVEIKPFFMAKHEVTRALWYDVQSWATGNGYTFQHTISDPSGSTKPITNINWRDAIVWCNAYSEKEGKQPVYKYSGQVVKDSRNTNATACDYAEMDKTKNGYRLPTEVEREFAARGGDPGLPAWNYPYAGSDTADTVAWHFGNASSTLKDVGGKTANRLGIFDLSGNAQEWGWDWMQYNSDVKPDTPVDGATSGFTQKPFPGGGAGANPTMSCVAYRWGSAPSYADGFVGFRVVRSAP